MEWYLMVWKKYAQFTGRSRRKELWMFFLFNMIIATALYVCGMATREQSSSLSGVFFVLYFVYALAALVPGWAVGARRLHDIGKSGWWWLIVFIPFVGAIVLIVFWVTDGQPGDNQYGSSPKGPTSLPAIG